VSVAGVVVVGVLFEDLQVPFTGDQHAGVPPAKVAERAVVAAC
jgi:hypothetical protein